MRQNDNRIYNVIESSLKNINNLIDVNTIVGTPIVADSGEHIIPISKVTIGILSGGGAYGRLNLFSKGNHPYSAGNGTIISLKPSAFLVKDVNNEYKLLNVSEYPYERIFDKTSVLIQKLTKDIKNEN
mgnify:CR=1 FL=1